VVDELPITAMGKVDTRALRALASDSTPGPTAAKVER
jgi:acyl-coenzyme A synthetase/AMP-(fatty) acid ligase